MTAAQPGGMECPQCHQIDRVQRVSAIVKAGTTTGTLTGITVGDGGDASHTLARDSQTLLSKLLASPQKSGALAWLNWQQVVVQAFAVVLLALVVGLIAAQVVLEQSGSNQDPHYAITVQSLFVGAIIFAFVWIRIVSSGNWTYAKRRKQWKRSYYCHRCDGFFIPNETKLIAPEDMQSWLRARKWKT